MSKIAEGLQKQIVGALNRLEFTIDPRIGIARVRRYKFNLQREIVPYSILFSLAAFSLLVMAHPLSFKLFLVSVYTLSLLIPLTSQFTLPATPVFGWLILFYSSQFIPKDYRPHIWVSVLPTLESVLYGANISDILTRWTNPLMDIAAWLPYGIGHFAIPGIIAAVAFIWGPPGSIKSWGHTFGWLNLTGVLIQILFPCAPPWYELRHGLVPANYGMKGSPGGLARIDALFGTGYTKTFTGAPVPFGAFPSLHAGNATLEALFLSHFFPRGTPVYWAYVMWLYWSTMYLTHHYLIDLVAGGALAVVFFYSLLPDEFRHLSPPSSMATAPGSALPLMMGDPEASTGFRGANGHANGYGGWEADEVEAESDA